MSSSDTEIEDFEDEETLDEEEGEEEQSDEESPDSMPMLKAFEEKFQKKINSGEDASQELNSDDERTEIRKELSTLSFEELQKLKQRIGCKKYQEAMHGKKYDTRTEFFRANKNRPREISSKMKTRQDQSSLNTVKKTRAPRDPRFDPLCGEYKEATFRKKYDFITDMRQKEMDQLKQELRDEENPKRKEKILYLIQRLKNQVREQKKHREEEEKRQEARQAAIEALKAGKKPFFAKKSDVKKAELVQKYEELRSKGKVDQFLAKKRKRNAQRDRKSLPSTSRE